MPVTFANGDDDESGPFRPWDYDDSGSESSLPDCLDCGTCDDCVQRSIDAYEADPDDKRTCSDCDGTGDAGDIFYRRSCPYCDGTGYVS